MKKAIYFLVAAAILFHFSAQAEDAGWKIDETLKFQVVYLPARAETAPPAAAPDKQFMEPLLKNIPAFKPDIDNIVYANILGLGFPLPIRIEPAALKLYLKLYAWPAQLDPVRSSRKIFNDFLLYGVAGGERLYESSKNPANVFVKYALIDKADQDFSEGRPLSAPPVPKQWEFDSHLPFSSIYVTPENVSREGEEADRAKASAQGVVAFHESLGKLYESSLRLLYSTNEKRYFADFRRCPYSNDRICAIRIYEVPLKPMVFDNYRDLPMPQDAEKVFLSGLLLVKITDYDVKSPVAAEQLEKMPLGTKAFASKFHPVWSHMLEVASVLDLR